jgi:hypothetical protein
VANTGELPALAATTMRGVRVRLAFVDDSRQANPRRAGLGELVAIGTVVIPEESIVPVADDLARIREELELPVDEELKWKPANGSALASLDGQKMGTLRRRMLQAAIDRDCDSVVVIWDRGSLPWKPEDITSRILDWLYERIEWCLGSPLRSNPSRRNDRGTIIADKPSGGRTSDDTDWLEGTLELTTLGTEYVAPRRVVLPMLTAHSHLVPHLQLADLVVGATTAAVAGRPGALPLAPLLQQLADADANGVVADRGIKLWPPDLKNLHHRVFGERHYQNATHGRGFELPNSELPYADDDGLPVTEAQPLWGGSITSHPAAVGTPTTSTAAVDR